MDAWIIAGITLTFRYDYMIYIEKIRIPFFPLSINFTDIQIKKHRCL